MDLHLQWIIFSNEVNTDLYYLSVAELYWNYYTGFKEISSTESSEME